MKRQRHILERDGEVRKLNKFQLGGNNSFIEIEYGDRISFMPSTNVTLTRIKETDATTGQVTHVISIAASGGGGSSAPSGGTITKTTSFQLTGEMNGKTIICRNSTADIIVTIPKGLGTDFQCSFISEDSGTRFVKFVVKETVIGSPDVVLKAPHGTILLTDYPCHLVKRTSEEVFNLQGELTP